MKTALILSAIIVSIAGASGGDHVGNGGDAVGLEFEVSYKKALQNIEVQHLSGFDQVLQANLIKKMAQTKILVVSKRLLTKVGSVVQESVAINTPSKHLIEVNRARWNAITDVHLKEALALHEVLSLVSLESTGQYPYSSLYAKNFSINADKYQKAVSWRSYLDESVVDYNQVLALPVFQKYTDFVVESLRSGEAAQDGDEGLGIYVQLSKPFEAVADTMCLVFVKDAKGWSLVSSEKSNCK